MPSVDKEVEQSEVSCVAGQNVNWYYHVVNSLMLSSMCDGEGNGSPLQYPCLENPMDRGAW